MKNFFIIALINFTYLYSQVNESQISKLQSMVLPGWGELTLGEKERANGFFIREAAIWILYLGGKQTAKWYKSDYTAFAELHANVDMSGKNYLFDVNIGHYDSMNEYNYTKERQRSVSDKYEEGKGFEWQWDDSYNRIKYDEMRIKSATSSKIAKFAIGGLILHRMVSFFDVIYLERKNSDFSISPKFSSDSNQLSINFSIKF